MHGNPWKIEIPPVIFDFLANQVCHLDATAPDMPFDEEFALLQPLVRDGLVQIEGRIITATEAGRSVVRVIAAVFDPHTRADTARFSKAV